jgi:hypothetical protein
MELYNGFPCMSLDICKDQQSKSSELGTAFLSSRIPCMPMQCDHIIFYRICLMVSSLGLYNQFIGELFTDWVVLGLLSNRMDDSLTVYDFRDTLAPFGATTITPNGITVSSHFRAMNCSTRPGAALPRFVWSAFSDAYPHML